MLRELLYSIFELTYRMSRTTGLCREWNIPEHLTNLRFEIDKWHIAERNSAQWFLSVWKQSFLTNQKFALQISQFMLGNIPSPMH